MRYTFKNKNGTHLCEIVQESEKNYTVRIIRSDGADETCRINKNVVLNELPAVYIVAASL